jgi:hypothetical protein
MNADTRRYTPIRADRMSCKSGYRGFRIHQRAIDLPSPLSSPFLRIHLRLSAASRALIFQDE